MHRDDLQLMRLLAGELEETDAEALRRRLEAEPELAAAYEALARVWTALGPGPDVAPDLGFRTRTMARVAADADSGGLGWAIAPTWAKVAAILALVVGTAIGSSVIALRGDGDATGSSWASATASSSQETLAESYMSTFAYDDGREEVR